MHSVSWCYYGCHWMFPPPNILQSILSCVQQKFNHKSVSKWWGNWLNCQEMSLNQESRIPNKNSQSMITSVLLNRPTKKQAIIVRVNSFSLFVRKFTGIISKWIYHLGLQGIIIALKILFECSMCWVSSKVFLFYVCFGYLTLVFRSGSQWSPFTSYLLFFIFLLSLFFYLRPQTKARTFQNRIKWQEQDVEETFSIIYQEIVFLGVKFCVVVKKGI